jgi:hypothetical protein
MRVRRSRMSSTFRAPSWVTANSNSARGHVDVLGDSLVGRAQRARATTGATPSLRTVRPAMRARRRSNT